MHNNVVTVATSKAKLFSKWPAAAHVTGFIITVTLVCTMSMYSHFIETSDLSNSEKAAQKGWQASVIEHNNIIASPSIQNLRSAEQNATSRSSSAYILSTMPSPSAACSSPSNMCPTFLLIGERKCGTSSLFHYLLQHSQVLPPRVKEVGFFTKRRRHVDNYFKKNFPPLDGTSEACMDMVELMKDGTVKKVAPFCKARSRVDAQNIYITGEASATYLAMANPVVVAQALPAARLVVVLRCPIRRAVSHHAMHVRFQREGRDQYKNLKSLKKSLKDELAKATSGELIWRTGIYLGTGVYVHNLKRWAKSFDRAAFTVVFKEDMEIASQSAAKLALFLQPIFTHLGIQDNLGADFFPSDMKTGAPLQLNVADASNLSSKISLEDGAVPGLSTEFVDELCKHIFSRANANLAVFLARPIPKSWQCQPLRRRGSVNDTPSS